MEFQSLCAFEPLHVAHEGGFLLRLLRGFPEECIILNWSCHGFSLPKITSRVRNFASDKYYPLGADTSTSELEGQIPLIPNGARGGRCRFASAKPSRNGSRFVHQGDRRCVV